MEDNGIDKKEINLKYVDKEKQQEKVICINKILEYVKLTGIIQKAMRTVREEIGIKESNTKKKKEPFWKRRILSGIGKL